MKLTLQCMFSPRLYLIYRDGSRETIYQPTTLEKWGDTVIYFAHTLFKIGLYTTPFISMYVYKRGLCTFEETKDLVKIFGGIGCLLVFSLIMRSIGRAHNPKYLDFLKAYTAQTKDQKSYIEALRKYDFEFSAWPVSYNVAVKERAPWKHPFKQCANSDLPVLKRSLVQMLAFIATHTFALRLIYPGTLGLIHSLLGNALLQGRCQLVEHNDGKRAKIAAADGNTIDTMFVDKRGNVKGKGNILVVCCEGNSGFYEVGIMGTPIKAGYSALGWNHPGFATSTGLPYPYNEQNAIDAVMQYAINELGFEPASIVLFGWSIGGYTAAWAAIQYPEIKALVLDATFDDLLPLAQKQMPQSWGRLVKEVVRSYVDLNVSELVTQYKGPVKLVRRTEDEIICLNQGQLATNRGNYLLLKLIETRHPDVLISSTALYKYLGLLDSQRVALKKIIQDGEQMRLLELIDQYMKDYNSSHCTPLPENHFEEIMTSITRDKRK